jgi:hypothetical protein
MNTVYESTLVEKTTPNRIENEDDAFQPLGTFAGTICKALYLNQKQYPKNRQC